MGGAWVAGDSDDDVSAVEGVGADVGPGAAEEGGSAGGV